MTWFRRNLLVRKLEMRLFVIAEFIQA